MHPLLAGFGPLGTPEVLIILALHGVVIAVVIGVVLWIRSQKNASTPLEPPPPPSTDPKPSDIHDKTE